MFGISVFILDCFEKIHSECSALVANAVDLSTGLRRQALDQTDSRVWPYTNRDGTWTVGLGPQCVIEVFMERARFVLCIAKLLGQVNKIAEGTRLLRLLTLPAREGELLRRPHPPQLHLEEVIRETSQARLRAQLRTRHSKNLRRLEREVALK